MLSLDEFGGPVRASITVLATSGLRQCRERYEQLTQAVREHSPDVVAVCGDFLEHPRFEAADRISVETCAAILAGLQCHELIAARGLRDSILLNQLKGSWPDEGLEFCLLNRSAKVLKRAVAVGFPPRSQFDEPWQNRYAEFRRWFSPILETHISAARTLWLLPEPPAFDMHQFTDTCREWRKAIDKFLPKVVLFGGGLNAPVTDDRMLWFANRETLLINLSQSPGEPLRYCCMELMFMGNVPCLPSEIEVTAHPAKESTTINGECWRFG